MWRMMSTPVEDESVTTIDVYTGCASLGVSIVGGIDTPLVTIIDLVAFSGGSRTGLLRGLLFHTLHCGEASFSSS